MNKQECECSSIHINESTTHTAIVDNIRWQGQILVWSK